MFARRAERLRSLADAHQLRAYLTFVADLSDVQHRLQAALPAGTEFVRRHLSARGNSKCRRSTGRGLRVTPRSTNCGKLLAMVERIAMPECAPSL
jgi:formate dehydrogenase maturation protein FdhE